jgi:hypothetical protein
MKIKILFATVLTLASFTAGYAQALDKAKLDQFFDRLAEKKSRVHRVPSAEWRRRKFCWRRRHSAEGTLKIGVKSRASDGKS